MTEHAELELVDVEEVLGEVLGELKRRLKDDAKSIPAHALVKLGGDLARLVDRRSGGDEEARGLIDPLEALSSLPPDRQRELLRDEIARYEARLADYRNRLTVLGTGE